MFFPASSLNFTQGRPSMLANLITIFNGLLLSPVLDRKSFVNDVPIPYDVRNPRCWICRWRSSAVWRSSPSEKTSTFVVQSMPSFSYTSLARMAKATGSPLSCRRPPHLRARSGSVMNSLKNTSLVKVSVRAMSPLDCVYG